MEFPQFFQTFVGKGASLCLVTVPAGVFSNHARIKSVRLAALYAAAQLDLKRILQLKQIFPLGEAFNDLHAVHPGIFTAEQEIGRFQPLVQTT